MLAFSAQEKRFVLLLLVSFLVGCAVNFYRQTRGSESLQVWHAQQRDLAQQMNLMPVAAAQQYSAQATRTSEEPAYSSLQRKDRLIRRINLNNATMEEMQQLEGIGPALAGRIMAYRETNRGFTTVEQLQEVKGIGPKTLARIRDRVCVK